MMNEHKNWNEIAIPLNEQDIAIKIAGFFDAYWLVNIGVIIVIFAKDNTKYVRSYREVTAGEEKFELIKELAQYAQAVYRLRY